MDGWDDFVESLKRIKMIEGSEFNVGSFISKQETVLSKNPEEAVRRSQFESAMRGEKIDLNGQKLGQVEENLINDFSDDLIDKLFGG